ncbi:MAG: transposase [Clostridium sp.]|uniref:transposase n=1 Tax=Anaerorhabdus sp. TaxID=1872524 RepID=UPI002FC5A581
MDIKINRCIRVTLKKCLTMDIKEIKQLIRTMNYMSCKACNKAMRMWLFHTQNIIEMKKLDKQLNIAEYEKATYNKSYRNVIEGEMKLLMPICNTNNVGTLHQQLVQNDWGRLKNNILKYKSNIPNYKLDTPYFIKNNNYKLRNDHGWFVDLTLLNKSGLRQYGYKLGHKFEFEIDTIDRTKKSIITNIINGIYTQGSSQLKISKKGKIELIVSYSFEKILDENLDKNRILGINLGTVNVATFSIWDDNIHEWDFMDYKNSILGGQEIIAFRQKLYSMGMSNKEIEKEIQIHNENMHRSQLKKLTLTAIDWSDINKIKDIEYQYKTRVSISSRCVGQGKIGHGYKVRIKPIDKVRDKIRNFADTFNHKYSKYIVDFAIKNNCGIIQMEDLSGTPGYIGKKTLKSWSYYDLQQKIAYKAKVYGIEIIKINSAYTSKRCSKCGTIKEYDVDYNNHSKFECASCGYKENIDINASKNISIPNIDKIINYYTKNN